MRGGNVKPAVARWAEVQWGTRPASGVVAALVGWALVRQQSSTTRRFHLGAALTGLIFATVGALFLLDAVGQIEARPEVLLPPMLVALGLAVGMNAPVEHVRAQHDGR